MNGHIKSTVSAGIRFSLILLWVYASVSKLVDYDRNRGKMLNQVFNPETAGVIVWAVPLAELSTAGLLIFKRTRTTGMKLSLFLFFQFTQNIWMVMSFM